MASKRTPNGYWNNFSNLERELIAFIEEHGTPSVMPTYTEFKNAGRGDLARAVSKHGGFPSIAARLGLESTYKAKPPGYWDDFFNLRNELLAFVESYGVSGVMPTQPELHQAGRSDLIGAIQRHGGHRSVSEKLDLAYEKRQSGYWQDPNNFERELFDFIKEYGTPGRMPTKPELLKAGRGDIQCAISTYYGGFHTVANRWGLTYEKKRSGHWKEFTNIERAIHTFIEKQGMPGVMPKEKELQEAGERSLVVAIKQHGGFPEVAKRLGLKLAYERKPCGHWQDLSNLKQELFTFADQLGTPGIMPKHEELEEAGRSDLISAIVKWGGYPSVAKQLGLKLTYKRNPKDKWDDFDSLRDELLTFVEQQGIPGRMPSQQELIKAGRTDINRGIQKHGGWQLVAENLGLNYAKKQPGYWDDFAKVEREIRAFIDKHGTTGVMPTSEELKKAGLSGLGKAISQHGGYPLLAAKLGLELAYTAKPADYWKEFVNLERELLAFIDKHGTTGVMATNTELYKAGLSSLGYAIQRHGGFSAVARRLGLAYSDKEYITPRTATEVEKTARAIQPLAESNLLSGAQVMVILRRAGLLEYRNKRVVRLGASLARGNHDEIETAISQLASTSEEITPETDNIEESENLTAEEAEALVNSGLASTENPPLDQSTPEPDIQREQAVIRGLTALGELRLPLDEVLSLLTSKLLWQAFYKRLYNWYGGLDAAQNITAEDVEAAILSTYPEHTDNEFVAEASAKFTLEVEQAVNFAASLPNYDWHGFRLRLHQADAARRMAEVLTNQDTDQ